MMSRQLPAVTSSGPHGTVQLPCLSGDFPEKPKLRKLVIRMPLRLFGPPLQQLYELTVCPQAESVELSSQALWSLRSNSAAQPPRPASNAGGMLAPTQLG